MKRSRLLVLLITAYVAGGCDDHGSNVPAGSPCANSQQISLPDCNAATDVSDESCVPLDDAIRNNRVMANDARAPSITAPTEMQAVPAAQPFMFAWTAPTAWRPRHRPMTVGDELRRWTTLLPEAEAHCNPFTGRGYELRFTAGGTVIFRRQQSALSWTPTAAEWSRLTTAIGTQTAELTIYTAVYSNNQISTGNGPFAQSMPRRFTLAR